MQIRPLETLALACQQDAGSAHSGMAGHSGRGSTDNVPPLWPKTEAPFLARLLTNRAATPLHSTSSTSAHFADHRPTVTATIGAVVGVGAGVGERVDAGSTVGAGVIVGADGSVAQAPNSKTATPKSRLNRVSLRHPCHALVARSAQRGRTVAAPGCIRLSAGRTLSGASGQVAPAASMRPRRHPGRRSGSPRGSSRRCGARSRR